MKNVLILGANGQIAQWVVKTSAKHQDIEQTLFIRNPEKVTGEEPANAKVVIGNVLNKKLLQQAMSDQDIVYANLAGEDLEIQAKSIIAAMQKAGVKRLMFVLSLGIYDEIPGKFGEWNDAIIGEPLKYYRRTADIIEASGLDYTILRPAWLTDEDEDEVDEDSTENGEVALSGVEDGVVELDSMTVRELTSLANSYSLETKNLKTKTQLIKAIQEHVE